MDQWLLLQGTHQGRRMIARLNRSARSLIPDRRHGIRIDIIVPFLDADHRGMPSDAEQNELAVFEDYIETRVAGSAVLVAVMTTSGMREFVLHTDSSDWIDGFQRDLAVALPTHKAQMRTQLDLDWTVYKSLDPG
jgi:hypothetical protein